MIRRLFGHTVCLTICLALGLGVSLAQGQDAFMERYTLAITSLEESVLALPEDSVESLEHLERAAGTLRPLSEATTSNSLISAMESTFERARTAIGNESRTDLAVQTEVLKGGFQRIAYEAALREARAGNRDLAQRRLAQVATDMALPQATLDAFNGPPLKQLQLTFERGVARAMAALIDEAAALAPNDIGGAYRKLAIAYGHYIPIQDSPRISPAVGETFVNAFSALVGQDGQGLSEPLDGLTQQAEALRQAVNTTFSDLGLTSTGDASSETASTPTASSNTATPLSSVVLETAPNPAQTVAEQANATQVAADVMNTTQTAPSAQGLAAATEAQQEARQEVRALERELDRYRLNPGEQGRLVELYIQNDLGGVEAALDTLYATAARVVAAVRSGNQEGARDATATFRGDYRRFLEPLVSVENSDVNNATLTLVDTLAEAPALRVQDAVVLIEQLDAVADVLAGTPPSMLHRVTVTAETYWVGFLRLTLMIVLGILAFVPLYLLNLAFGGGNRNWRWIGVSLFLLLLPVIFEGLTFLGSLLAGLTGVEVLNVLAGFSIFQNTLSQLVWVVLIIVAIGFATMGLYGICVQFGLLGRNGNSAEPSTQMTARDNAPEAVVDWDEEF